MNAIIAGPETRAKTRRKEIEATDLLVIYRSEEEMNQKLYVPSSIFFILEFVFSKLILKFCVNIAQNASFSDSNLSFTYSLNSFDVEVVVKRRASPPI